MTPNSIRTITNHGTGVLQQFNQNSLDICHNMLRHLPKSKTAFQSVYNSTIDRVSEIESFLLDQTEKLIEISNKSFENPDYSIDIPPMILRNDTEKRFVALLNHFISYSEKNNKKVFDTLSMSYGDNTRNVWNKAKVDRLGGELKGTNPLKLYRFLKAVAHSSDPNGELTFSSPMLKEPSKELKYETELKEIDMSLVANGTLDIPDDISEEELTALLAEISVYAEALKYKENSIKLRQEILISTFEGNPNGTLKDMILQTNAMSMELRKEQQTLGDLMTELADISKTLQFSKSTSLKIEKVNAITDSYTLMKDDKLNFIVRSEELDAKMMIGFDNEFEITSKMKA
jgi:hypothetical protein